MMLLISVDQRMFSLEDVLAWVACWLLFVLADLLAGPVIRGLWAGYLSMAALVGWFIMGEVAGLAVLFAGALTAAFIRLWVHVDFLPAYRTYRETVDTALTRLAINGVAILAAFGAFYLFEPANPGDHVVYTSGLKLGLVIAVCYAAAIGGGWLLAPETQGSFSQIGRIALDALPLALAPALALTYDRAGLLPFVMLMGLVSIQMVRYDQINRARDSLASRVDELSLLNSMGANINNGQTATLDDVLENMYRHARQIVPLAAFYVALYDRDQNRIEYRLMVENDERTIQPQRDLAAEDVTAIILEQPEILRLTSAQMAERGLTAPAQVEFSEFVGLPLMVATRPFGVLSAMTPSHNPVFSQEQIDILQTVAHQSSLAIRNMTLYNRSIDIARSLSLINRSVQEVMFNFDSQDAIRTACDTALRITGAQRAALFLVDPDNRQQIHVGHTVNLTPRHLALYATSGRLPDVLGQNPRIITDVRHLKRSDPLVELAEAGGFNAMAETLLKSGAMPTGILSVFHDEPHIYNDTERELLETLAYQITAALDNAELLKALELYASEQAQLVHLSRISTASLNLDTIIDSVSQLLRQMLGVARANIGLLEPDGIHLRLVDDSDDKPFVPDITSIPELAAMREQMQPTPRIIYRDDADVSEMMRNMMDTYGDVTLTVVPMIANNTLLGVISMGHPEPRYFTDGEWRLIEMAANQIATQIHNAQLHQRTEDALIRRLEQLGLIEIIARQISSALDVDQLIRNVLEAAIRATQADFAVIGLLTDSSGEMLVRGQEYNGQEWVTYENHRPANTGLMGRVLASGKSLIVPDNGQEPDYFFDSLEHYQSSLIVPMILDDQIIGVLNLESLYRNFFNEEKAEFVSNLAGHAVISIQNAQLLQERQNRIETLTLLRDLSLRLSGTSERGPVTEAILRTGLDVVLGSMALLYRRDAYSGDFNLAGTMTDTGKPIPDADRLIPGELRQRVIANATLVAIHDVAHHEDFIGRDMPSPQTFTGLIVAPILQGSVVENILCVALPARQPLSESAINAVELLAIQAGGLLQNIELVQRIRASSNRMRAILDSTRDGIILLDRDLNLIDTNTSAERLLGIPLEEHIDKNFAITLLNAMQAGGIQEDSVRDALTDMARVLRTEPRRITRRSLDLRSGSNVRYIEEVGSPVIDSQANIMGRLLTLRDVTEERLLAAYRDEISHMVVHDLRGPLSSIISGLTLALDIIRNSTDSTVIEMTMPVMEVSIDSASTLMQLIDSLLDIAKLETREMPLVRAATDVQELVQSAFESLSTSFQEANLAVDIDIDSDLPPVDIDGSKIRRVIINLLDNAVRYTPSNERIQISARKLNRHKIVVRVSDSGRGIPPDERERIFEKFRQIKGNTPSRGRKGSGLGLTFCKLAVEAHGERIWVDDGCELPGACFAFTLPIATEIPEASRVDTITTS